MRQTSPIVRRFLHQRRSRAPTEADTMRREPRAPATAFACLALTAGLVACAQAEPPAPREIAFTCADGETIVASFPAGGEAVVLDIEGERVELPRVYAATGAEYSDGSTTFYTTGSGATLERDGKTHADCVSSQVPSQPRVTFGAQSSTSTLRWPGHAGDRRTLWRWSDVHRPWR
jgi:membrane-bound inhibitor of C-type lysozyme